MVFYLEGMLFLTTKMSKMIRDFSDVTVYTDLYAAWYRMERLLEELNVQIIRQGLV